jgi:CTP:molybdopterin cytidylyltransferase MocA
MRTTITLDDDIVELVVRHAKLRRMSLGRTVSELVRRGLRASTPAVAAHGLVMFQLPGDSPTVTTGEVRRIEAEGA